MPARHLTHQGPASATTGDAEAHALVDKLVHEVNQISAFFESQPGGRAAEDVAEFLRQFWAPSRRNMLIARVGQRVEPLRPAALAALKSLAPAAAEA